MTWQLYFAAAIKEEKVVCAPTKANLSVPLLSIKDYSNWGQTLSTFMGTTQVSLNSEKKMLGLLEFQSPKLPFILFVLCGISHQPSNMQCCCICLVLAWQFNERLALAYFESVSKMIPRQVWLYKNLRKNWLVKSFLSLLFHQILAKC